jgi:hypothetical protein
MEENLLNNNEVGNKDKDKVKDKDLQSNKDEE